MTAIFIQAWIFKTHQYIKSVYHPFASYSLVLSSNNDFYSYETLIKIHPYTLHGKCYTNPVINFFSMDMTVEFQIHSPVKLFRVVIILFRGYPILQDSHLQICPSNCLLWIPALWQWWFCVLPAQGGISMELESFILKSLQKWFWINLLDWINQVSRPGKNCFSWYFRTHFTRNLLYFDGSFIKFCSRVEEDNTAA